VTAVAAALRPATAAECASALAEASGARRSLRVRGAGTKSYLGELLPTDLVLETTGMSGIVDHVPADLTVTVAAGARLAELQAALAAHGQHLPLDPPHAETATIGGIVAADSNGFGRVRYGGVRDLLIGTVVALADGTVAHGGGRVVKNVAGYDINKLFIGSLGTLGVICEATLKILPLPVARAAAVARCAQPAAAFAIADALLRTPLRPAALVVEGTRQGWRAVVAAHGIASQVERAMTETARAAEEAGASTERVDEDAMLGPLRELPATAIDGALIRAALPLAAQRSFAESAARLDTFERCVADAGSGLVRIHLRGDDDAVIHAADTLLAAAAIVGGSARVERRDEGVRARLGAWAAARPGGDFLMRRIKEAFDPAGVLEPGRSIVG
jgi:glycolate oxidase FAD binding subunit